MTNTHLPIVDLSASAAPVVDLGDGDAPIVDLRKVYSQSGVSKTKAFLKEAQALSLVKVDRFKVGKAYRLTKSPNTVLFINAIGYHPLCALPTGFGYLCSETGSQPMYVLLHELGTEVTF